VLLILVLLCLIASISVRWRLTYRPWRSPFKRVFSDRPPNEFLSLSNNSAVLIEGYLPVRVLPPSHFVWKEFVVSTGFNLGFGIVAYQVARDAWNPTDLWKVQFGSETNGLSALAISPLKHGYELGSNAAITRIAGISEKSHTISVEAAVIFRDSGERTNQVFHLDMDNGEVKRNR
jgi:hypothetical protein